MNLYYIFWIRWFCWLCTISYGINTKLSRNYTKNICESDLLELSLGLRFGKYHTLTWNTRSIFSRCLSGRGHLESHQLILSHYYTPVLLHSICIAKSSLASVYCLVTINLGPHIHKCFSKVRISLSNYNHGKHTANNSRTCHLMNQP